MAGRSAPTHAGWKLRAAGVLVLFGVILVVAAQNVAVVELRMFGWSFEARRIFVIGGSFVVGIAAGWLLRGPGPRR